MAASLPGSPAQSAFVICRLVGQNATSPGSQARSLSSAVSSVSVRTRSARNKFSVALGAALPGVNQWFDAALGPLASSSTTANTDGTHVSLGEYQTRSRSTWVFRVRGAPTWYYTHETRWCMVPLRLRDFLLGSSRKALCKAQKPRSERFRAESRAGSLANIAKVLKINFPHPGAPRGDVVTIQTHRRRAAATAVGQVLDFFGRRLNHRFFLNSLRIIQSTKFRVPWCLNYKEQ